MIRSKVACDHAATQAQVLKSAAKLQAKYAAQGGPKPFGAARRASDACDCGEREANKTAEATRKWGDQYFAMCLAVKVRLACAATTAGVQDELPSAARDPCKVGRP